MAENEALALARSMYKDNKKQEARTLLANAIIQAPNDADLWFGLAFCLEDKDQIIYSLNRVLQINPNHPKAADELRKRTDNSLTEIISVEDKPHHPAAKPAPSTPPSPSIPTPEEARKSDDYFLNVVVKGEAGKSTAETGEKWRYRGLYIGIFISILLAGAGALTTWNAYVKAHPFIYFALIIFSVSALFWAPKVWDPVFNKSQQFRQGARAEVRVGETLKALGPNYLIINDIQTGRGNIDHLVLSKTGAVFVIETKSHFGRLEISKDELFHNGYKTEKDFIKQVLGNTFWVKERLAALGITTAWITPILVFTNLWVTESQPIKGVYIENVKFLNRRITGIAHTNRNNQVWEKRAEIVHAMGK